jgi:hypothetical protein
MGLAALGGLVPYAYSLYVIGYWGLMSLRSVGTSGVLWPIGKAVFFVALGFSFLKSFYHVTEIGRKVDGVLRIGDS